MVRSFRSISGFALQLTALSLAHLVAIVIGAQLAGAARQMPMPPNKPPAPQVISEPSSDMVLTKRAASPGATRGMMGPLVFMCLLNSMAMLICMRHTTLRGFAFVAAVFGLSFACYTFMPQMDMWFFNGEGP